MKTSQAERLRKVQALYDRATSPGEKSAALEALNRIREASSNWIKDILLVLSENGFWKYMFSNNQTRFVRVPKIEYVEVLESDIGGSWKYVYDNGDGYNRIIKSGTDFTDLSAILEKKGH